MAIALQFLRSALALALRRTLHAAALAGALVMSPPSAAATSQATPAVHPYAVAVTEAAQRFGIPETWIWRVMHAESRGNRRAVSPAGAMGLMQVMPGTWSMLTSRHRLGRNPFDVRANILAGAAYLRAMWDRYRDIRLMLAAYNAGPGRVDAYAAGRRGLPAETLAYVAGIAPALGSTTHNPAAAALPSAAPGWRDAGIFADRKMASFGEQDVAALPLSRLAEGHSRAPVAAAHPLFVPVSGKDY
jgi:soluble lytic murein transglycosylase-like protein